jgi:putative membrane protein
MATAAGAAGGDTPALNESTRLAITRTHLAAERTLMSWVRTGFAMISFGFTIGKFLQYLSKQPAGTELRGDIRLMPAVLIVLGLISLFLGVYEFRRTHAALAETSGERPHVTALGTIVMLVALLGALAFTSLFLRLGPLK